MEECSLLTDAGKRAEREEKCMWKTHHIHRCEEKGKGPVDSDKEEEEDKLKRFFCYIYKFHIPDTAPVPVFVPEELPPRYAISFVPAENIVSVLSGLFTNSIHTSAAPVALTDFPIVSSFVPAKLPARYTIPSVPVPLALPVIPTCSASASATTSSVFPLTEDFSVVASANFVL